jgi:hypothetical protein
MAELAGAVSVKNNSQSRAPAVIAASTCATVIVEVASGELRNRIAESAEIEASQLLASA